MTALSCATSPRGTRSERGRRAVVSLCVLAATTLAAPVVSSGLAPPLTPSEPLARAARTPPEPSSARTAIAWRPSPSLALAPDHLGASVPVPHAPALLGWGNIQLYARPLDDELFVRVVVGSPTREQRWSRPCDVVLRIDGDTIVQAAEPVGARVDDTLFHDALRFELRIDVVRRLARASHAESSFCGDRIGLGPEDRAILRRFVEEFDARALALPPQRETPVARMPTDPDAIVDDPDLFLEPT